MRIKCPECDSVLTLADPKPGSYRPTCKHCHQAFRLKVTDDRPPKFGVGRIAKPASETQQTVAPSSAKIPASAEPAKVSSAAVSIPTVKAAAVRPAVSTAVDATIDGSLPAIGATVIATIAGVGETLDPAGTAVDATIDTSGTAVDATMQSQTGNSTPGKTVVSSARKITTSENKPSDVAEIPERLGGYRIVRLLGRGAMGAVYEAKQVSLDRQVALKTIRDRLSKNPSSLARFIREAYAAAQLTHHNVVQIYDFGEDDGRHFFSMEWIRGGPLDDVVRKKGALDPRLAAGYALQAARGLQFAHRNGMVHRDVKPANLLLSDEGVVKVADLGLVKIPDHAEIESEDGESGYEGMSRTRGRLSGTDVTMQGTAVGTPAYMAPEQTINAAGVDHRADIYSLGCTLFYFLTGRPPFDGSVATEVMEKHANEAPPDITTINPRVPKALAQIIERSIAKRPSDRYPSLVECIADLESFLGLGDEGGFSPTSAQADVWEQIASRYASATSLKRLDRPILAGVLLVALLMTLFSFGLGFAWWLTGVSMLSAAVATPLCLAGSRSPIHRRLRSWIASLSIIDWATALIGAAMFLLVIVLAGAWPGVVTGLILGACFGAVYHFGIAIGSEKKSQGVIHDAEKFVRDMRISGADEPGLRSFAARYAGKRWQGLYERMFGYDSLIEIRETLRTDPSFSGGVSGKSLRDKVCDNLAGRAATNREAADQKRLAKVEQRGLQSEGMSAAEAENVSLAMAQATMQGSKLLQPAESVDAKAAADARRERMKAMLADARSGKHKVKRDPLGPLRFVLGGQTRLVAGCVLLGIFAIWGNSQGLFDSIKDMETLKQIGAGNVDFDQLGSAVRDAAMTADQTESSSNLIGKSITPWSVAIAGLLLAMSAFVSGWRMSIPAIIATIVILLGPSLGIPGVGEAVSPWMVSALAGVIVYLPGIFFGESPS